MDPRTKTTFPQCRHRMAREAPLDPLEIGFFGGGHGGDQDACEPHRGRVVDNCCGDYDSEDQDHDLGASGEW
jgi:hypothetical protein